MKYKLNRNKVKRNLYFIIGALLLVLFNAYSDYKYKTMLKIAIVEADQKYLETNRNSEIKLMQNY